MSGEVEMEIKSFVWDVVDTNSFLIIEGNHGLLIDAIDQEDLYRSMEPLETLSIILTHCHFDHIIGLNRIRRLKPNNKVIATRLCSEKIGNIYRNMSSTATAFVAFYEEGRKKNIQIEPFTCAPADQIFEEEMDLIWCDHHIRFFAVHGHSDDSLIAVLDEKYLFSGDTLLPIPTVTRFRGGSTKRFWEEDMPRLREMRNIETVFPGHGMRGKLGEMVGVNEAARKYRGYNASSDI